MPGRPKTAALEAHLREEVEGEPRYKAVLELIANGEMLSEIAPTIRVPYLGEIWVPSRRTLSTVMHKIGSDELAEARRAAGEMYAESALDTALKAPETKEGIAKAREVSAVYRWLASKRDPANFGDTPATAIQINNPGQMFLQAVARPGAVPPPKKVLRGDVSDVSIAPKDETNNDGA